MAGDIPPILIDVQVEMGRVKSQLDTLQAEIREVGTVAKAQEPKIGGLEKKLGGLAGSFKKMAGAAAIATTLVASAKAAAEDAQSQSLLANQLKLTTGANEEQIASVEASIKKMSEVTGVLDDDIRPAFASLVRATGDVAASQSLTTLALDAAAAKGKDLTTVANALAKAHNGNTRQLAMLFPELKNSKDMMGDLAKETKGMAAAAADANPLLTLNQQFEELKETLGKALMPLLRSISRILKPLMPIFEKLADVIEYVVEALMPLVEKIVDAVAPAFDKLMTALKPIIDKLLPPLIKLLDKVFIPILSFLADLIGDYIVPWIEKLADVMGDTLTWAVDMVVAGFQNMQSVLGPFWKNVLKPLIDGFMAMIGIKIEPEIEPTVNLRRSEMEATGALDYSGKYAIVGGKTKKDPAAEQAKKVAADIIKAQTDYQKKVLDAQKQYQDDVTKRMKDFTKAFADATRVDVSTLFNEGYQSASLMIEGLKMKLAATKEFAADIGKLSAQNYSEDFLNQIMSLGPVMGHQMAEMLLTSAPEVQDEIKSLFSESQLISRTGVDAVAKNLIPTFTDATTRLGNAMVDAANSLTTALGKIANITPEKIISATNQANQNVINASNGKTGNNITVNTNVTNSGSSATEIAAMVVNSIKFNTPLVLNNVFNQITENAYAGIEAEFSNPYRSWP